MSCEQGCHACIVGEQGEVGLQRTPAGPLGDPTQQVGGPVARRQSRRPGVGLRFVDDPPDPKNRDAILKKTSWPRPPVLSFLQDEGPVEEEEMFRVFNMGIGFVLVVAEDFAHSISEKLSKFGETVYTIGHIGTGTGKVVLS